MTKDTFAWRDTKSIEAAVNRAVAELRDRFDPYLVDAPMIFAGFSQGATLAAPFLVTHGARFPVAVIAEGGYNYLADAKFARDYRAAGGKRVMILCGTKGCFLTANRAKTALEKAGLDVIVAGDELSGHNLNLRMQNALRRTWHELVRDVPGWETFGRHRWAAPDAVTEAPRPK